MADDQASQRRSRFGPPPTTSATSSASTFRAQPGASRFGFGSSTPRTPFGGASNAASNVSRTSTLSTTRHTTTTFSSSAFGRSTTTRPSSAESAASRLRQKPTTTTATSAPKQAATTDLFASLATEQPPRSSSGSALPMASSAQLFSMDDADLGDDGWGVDSPSAILSPASATNETTLTNAAASKPFEDEDEFGWGNDTTVSKPVAAQVPAPVPVPAVLAPVPAAPELTTTTATTTTTTTTTTGWGGEFGYTEEAIEASTADTIAWNDDDAWGKPSAPQGNGATATPAPLSAPKAPLTTTTTTSSLFPAPPLSTASADLGAILSPTMAPAGEFWGDEGDDVLFSDEELPPPAPLEETPLPDVGALSLDSEEIREEAKHVDVVAQPPVVVASEFAVQECETTDTATEAVPETDEWEEEEGDWGEQLRLSEVMDESPALASAHADYVSESISETVKDEASPPADVPSVPGPSEEFEADSQQTQAFKVSTEPVESPEQPPLDTAPSAVFSEEPVQYSHEEAHTSTAYGFGESAGYAYESQSEYNANAVYAYESQAENVEVENLQADAVSEETDEAHTSTDYVFGENAGHANETQTAYDASAGFTYETQAGNPQGESVQVNAVSEEHTQYSHEAAYTSTAYGFGDNAGYTFENQVEFGESNAGFAHESQVENGEVEAFESHAGSEEQNFRGESHKSTNEFGFSENAGYAYENQGEFGENTGHSFESQVEQVKVENTESVHLEYAHHHEKEQFATAIEEVNRNDVSEGIEEAAFGLSNVQLDADLQDESSSETVQRQVSWEAQDKVAAPMEDNYGSSYPPPIVPTNKAEVSFGTSSFAAAELTYGHYHHDHHRTPSEAEAGSVASFAEASSAGATFGGSDHVSDGTYSDGEYASETRSVFGSSSAHSTAFITEPASSSDGQGSNEENGTYDHRSDLSSTVGGGGGASEFDVSSTRSAVFENEVASTGFDEGYEFGDHGHQHHFGGDSYDNEYNHDVSNASAAFTEEVHASFGHADDSMFPNRVPEPQQSPSPVYSRSSTPATYGVSSSQDLPTASDLEFDHSDTENLFASSSSEQETASFGATYHSDSSVEASQASFAVPPVSSLATETATPFQSNPTEEEDANPFASSGSSFPSAPVSSFGFLPVEPPRASVVTSNDDVLPSADSLFGSSPAKGSPFGAFASPQHATPAYDEPPLADAGALFGDAPAAPGFGGFEQAASASTSSFFGESHGASNNNYGYDTSVDQAFGGSSQSHGFESQSYGYDSSYQSASEAFGGQSQASGIEGSYQPDTYSHQTAADAFGAPSYDAYDAQGDAGFGAYGSSSGEGVSAENFFGASSASADDVFGSGGTSTEYQNQGAAQQQYDGYEQTETWQSGSEYPAQSSFELYATEESAPVDDFGHPPQDHSAEIPNADAIPADIHDASFESKDLPSTPNYAQDWSHGATSVSHSFETHQAPPTVVTEETNAPAVEEPVSSPFDHSYSGFGESADTESFFGRGTSAPPTDPHPSPSSFPGQARVDATSHPTEPPARSTSAPPSKPSTGFESAPAPVEPEEKALSNEVSTNFGEGAEPFGYGEAESSSYGFESGGHSEFATQYNDQSLQQDGALGFGGDANSAANPFEQGADSAFQSDSASFFGGRETSGAFGEATGNDTSGFFSNGPANYHHSGAIYAQPPQDSATPAYHRYDSTSYSQQHERHDAYASHASEFASSNDYSQHTHGQSESFGAHAAASHAQHTGFGAPPHANVRSPTTVASSYFDSAPSGSASQYHNRMDAAPKNDVSGGIHYQQPDVSHAPSAYHPSATPKTPTTMDSAPQHVAAPHAAYDQYAAPPQVSGYSSRYDAMPTDGYVGAAAKVLTSNKHKDPNMVVPSCLPSFGFGGNVVTMFPKQKLRLNSASFAARSSPRTPQSMQFDNAPQGELRKGPIGVYRMEHVHPRTSDYDELDKFPGPLNENVPEETLLQYVEEKMGSTPGSTHLEEDERLLLGILRVLIKCNGRLRSDVNANPNEPTSPEVQLVSLLKESDQRRRRNHQSQFPPPKPVQYPTQPDATLRNASRIRELLLLGDRKAAVDVAIHAQMWPEAMLIGSFTDKDEYKRVLTAYFASHYAPGDPCRALYLSFADQQERSVHEPQKLMQGSKDEESSAILSTWVVHVQMLLANRTADTNKILVELGDRLWKEANAVGAAHVCYLLAGNTVEAPSPNSKIALLGADHRSPEEARFYVSPAAVQRTEIYEWVQKKINPAATSMIPFQGYKLIYAMILADHGKLETAFRYVNSMLTVIRTITATMKPGTSMYLEGMQNQLVVLDDRLRQHLGQDRADSVAAAASAKQGKWGLGSALSIMGKIVNRVVEGSDAPQQAGPPRSANGSLFPGAPRSNNNNMPSQPEYPSGAAIGYSSQSAPTMVPSAAPGSGRSGGIYAAQPPPYQSTSANHSMVAPPAAPAPPPAPTPSVPAAFNVPRNKSGRNSAPPHQPMPDFSAPGSGSGGYGFGGPPPGGNSVYDAPPQQLSQPPPSFPPSANSAAPPVEAPPPFQKPSLDLSGSAGNSGFGNEPPVAEASKPKSPPRSPRRSGDAPGSDKGSASPKAKDAKKGGRSKTPPPSRSSSGWLTGLSSFIAAKMNPDAKVAKMGNEHMEAYFDEEKKRWVFPGEPEADEPTMPSAPPIGPLPGSTPASSSGGPPGGPPGTHSAPGSMAGAGSDDPLAALMAPPPARALMKKDPLAAMMAPPPVRTFGPRSNIMPAKRPPRPQFAVFKPAPGSTTSSAPGDQGPPSSSGDDAPPQ